MLQDLLIGKIPFNVTPLDFSKPNWDILLQLWNFNNPNSSVKFGYYEHPSFGRSWEIQEFVADGEFHMTRSCITKQRNTIIDSFGLLGLSLINPKDTRVITTEGVSDYFTAKLLCPSNNVLGVTTLGGSSVAKKLLINLFDTFIICSDNDSKSSVNTGLNNSYNWKRFLSSFSKQVHIFIPDSSCKDITDNLIKNLRFSSQFSSAY